MKIFSSKPPITCALCDHLVDVAGFKACDKDADPDFCDVDDISMDELLERTKPDGMD